MAQEGVEVGVEGVERGVECKVTANKMQLLTEN